MKNILMPALSPTMEKGNLVTWLKSEGDKIELGDIIAEIETDKATMEVEAMDKGVLGKILIKAGTEDVSVNTPIAILLENGENASDIKLDSVSVQNPNNSSSVNESTTSSQDMPTVSKTENTAQQCLLLLTTTP